MAYILLIEPDRRLAGNYVATLEAAGHEVYWCISGQVAIHAADERHPDLVVLELQLKGHNGIEFLYEFRSYPEWQTIPVIVQSLVPPAALENMAAARWLDIHTYLYKPQSRLSHLVEAVDTIVSPTPSMS